MEELLKKAFHAGLTCAGDYEEEEINPKFFNGWLRDNQHLIHSAVKEYLSKFGEEIIDSDHLKFLISRKGESYT